MKKTKTILLFLILTLTILSGCGSYNEVNQMAIISGGGIDFDGENYTLACQVVIPKEKDSSSEIVSVSDVSPAVLFEKINASSGLSGYFSHAEVFVLSEQLAQSGLAEITDNLFLNDEIRFTSRMVVAKDDSLTDILSSVSPSEDISCFAIYDLVSTPPINIDMPFYKYLSSYFDCDPALPAISLRNGVPYISGTAIFKKDKLVGYIDVKQTEIFSLLRQSGRDFIYVTDNGSYQIKKSRCNIRPVIKDGKPIFNINLTITAEPQGDIKENHLSQYLGKDIIKLFNTLKNEYHSDPLGLVPSLYMFIPNYNGEFDDYYSSFEIVPNIIVDFEKSSKTGGDGDENR